MLSAANMTAHATKNGAATFMITTFGRTTLNIGTFSIMYAECCVYAGALIVAFFTLMLSAVLLIVILLSVVAPQNIVSIS
jgi:hypothetical protein